MNIEAFYASRQLEQALDNFTRGRIQQAFDSVRRAKVAVDKILTVPTEPSDDPHAEACMCRSCHESMLERL